LGREIAALRLEIEAKGLRMSRIDETLVRRLGRLEGMYRTRKRELHGSSRREAR
jgi:hypothetical protein